MKTVLSSVLIATSIAWLLTTPSASGAEITARELRALLARPGPHPVLIDIRMTADYTSGSIPGAINIPARVLLERKMRFSRGCVLISDGLLDKVDPAKLAAELRATGVGRVDYLRGGLAAWSEMVEAPTTAGRGALIGRTNSSVTYQDIAKRKGSVCLVDLRQSKERVVPAGHQCPVKGFCLKREFEYLPDLKAFHKAHAGKTRSERAGEGPLVVLIPGSDTDAQHELKKLHVEGYRRVAVLLGGAEIIAADGRRGVKRSGGAVVETDGKRFVPGPTTESKQQKVEPKSR